MKLLTLVVVLAGVVLGAVVWRSINDDGVARRTVGHGPVPTQLPREMPEGYEQVVFAVEGICTCSGCPEKLYKALHDVETVQAAAVDPIRSLVSVFLREGADSGEVLSALTFEDYEPRLIEL